VGAVSYTVFARNSLLKRKGTIPYTTLDANLVFCGAGSWSLTLPGRSEKGALLGPGSGILIRDDLTGGIIASGPARRRLFTVAEPDRGPARETLTVSGVTDDWWLYTRAVYPDPAAASTAQTTTAAYTANTNAETIMRNLVNLNAGPGALTARKVFGLVLETNLSRGATVKTSNRFDRLADAVTAAATAGGLGWNITQQAAEELPFHIFEPDDKSGSVRFSRKIGNLRSFNYELLGPEATVAIVAGQGTGTARTFREAVNTAAESEWACRIEDFGDRRDTNDTGTLDQAGGNTLAERGPTSSLSMSPIDTPKCRFAQHYYLGDIVSVDIGDDEWITDVVRQVKVSANADRTTVAPLIGSDSATPSNQPQHYKTLAAALRRIAGLERRV